MHREVKVFKTIQIRTHLKKIMFHAAGAKADENTVC